jgi:hypothetical protein
MHAETRRNADDVSWVSGADYRTFRAHSGVGGGSRHACYMYIMFARIRKHNPPLPGSNPPMERILIIV